MPKGQILTTKIGFPSNKYETDEMSKYPYKNLITCLSFITGQTWPDIMYAVNL